MDPNRGAVGSLGPRLAGRLTAELILRSPQFMNCCKEYEIDLRGAKINAIENLGATQNQFDCVDLSDNAVIFLDGFPKLPRLKTLFLNNNRVTRIARGLEEFIPSLATLVLTGNRLKNLQELDPLGTLPKLTHLSLLDNEVTKQPKYRLYVVHRCRKLKVLDFRKVKEAERKAAAREFGPGAAPAPAPAGSARTFEPGEGLAEAEGVPQGAAAGAGAGGREVEMETEAQGAPEAAAQQPRRPPTQEELVAIKAAIANAATMEEVDRLENALKMGVAATAIKLPPSAVVAAAKQGSAAAAAAPAAAAAIPEQQPPPLGGANGAVDSSDGGGVGAGGGGGGATQMDEG